MRRSRRLAARTFGTHVSMSPGVVHVKFLSSQGPASKGITSCWYLASSSSMCAISSALKTPVIRTMPYCSWIARIASASPSCAVVGASSLSWTLLWLALRAGARAKVCERSRRRVAGSIKAGEELVDDEDAMSEPRASPSTCHAPTPPSDFRTSHQVAVHGGPMGGCTVSRKHFVQGLID